MTDPRERIEAVLDFPTSFDSVTIEEWKREMADSIVAAIGLVRHTRTEWTLYNAAEGAYRLSLGHVEGVWNIEQARERMAPYHGDGDGYEVIERVIEWWSTPTTSHDASPQEAQT